MRERELKLVVDPSYQLPSLDHAVPGATLTPPQRRTNRDIYHDTEDLRLLRWGVTLRWRAGTGWVVKLPNPASGPGLDRLEIEVAGGAGEPPAEALALVVSLSRGAPLAPVAEIATVRTARTWLAHDGSALAELADDDVTVRVLHLTDGTQAATVAFREIEVELASDADGALLDVLAAALAVDPVQSPVPKLARALGPAARCPPDVVVGDLGVKPSAAAVIQTAIAASVTRLVLHLPIVRIGVDPEGVHQARVAIRRLRSDLQTFGPLLDAEWSDRLRRELTWLASELGRVRDADVLDGLLHSALDRHPEIDPVAGERILAALHRQRHRDRHELLDHLDNRRTIDLLDHLVAAAARPQLRPAASRPAVEALPPLVHGRWRQLRRAVKVLPSPPRAEDLHQIRILAKRVRYASEAVAPAVGRPASRFAANAAVIQQVLGEWNDAVVAGRWLETTARSMGGPSAFAAGRLAQQLAVDGIGRGRGDEWRPAFHAMRRRSSWMVDRRQ